MTETPTILPHSIRGPEGRPPIVLLHGFAGDREGWINLQIATEAKRRTIAFDLPGHGAAADWPQIGNAGVGARALIASLDALGIDDLHLVGHSLGGAIATIVAFKLAASRRVKSLTLIAPGGFGTEINARLLRRFATASDRDELQALIEQFFGWEQPVPRAIAERMAAARRDPVLAKAHAGIVETILDGNRQKSLDLKALADLPHPVKVIWGTQDRVVPTRQSHNLPGTVATHVFPGVGHMPHLEVPREVARLVLEAAAVA